MLILAYAAVLILVVLNFNSIMRSLWGFVSLFKSFFIGIAIAFVLNTPCMLIEGLLIKKVLKGRYYRWVKGLAIIISYLLLMLIIFILTMFIIPQLIESVQLFFKNAGSYLNNLQNMVNQGTSLFKLESINLPDLSGQIFESAKKISENIYGLASQIIIITTGVFSFFVTLIISLIFSIYLLGSKERILGNLNKVAYTYLPRSTYRSLRYIYKETIDVFNKFVYGQLAEAVILGVLCFLGMLVFGFEYPLMISTIIGITALLPYVGAYIGGFVSFVILLMVSPLKAVWFIVFLIVLQQFEGNIIYPRVVGGSLGIPGIWVLLAAIVGGGLAGPLGILLGVPIVTVLYTLLKNDVHKREIRRQISRESGLEEL